MWQPTLLELDHLGVADHLSEYLVLLDDMHQLPDLHVEHAAAQIRSVGRFLTWLQSSRDFRPVGVARHRQEHIWMSKLP